MELLIAATIQDAIKHAGRQGWQEVSDKRNHGGVGGLVWEREHGIRVRYVGTPQTLHGWARGTVLHEVPGAGGTAVWAEAKRLVQLGRLRPY